MDEYKKIRTAITALVNRGEKHFIICPFGELGLKTKQVLNECFGITERLVIDNELSKYNPRIKTIEYLKEIDLKGVTVLLTVASSVVKCSLKESLLEYCEEEQIVEVFSEEKLFTRRGRHSYGPLCNHPLVESVGSFCSFAKGSNVLMNHPTTYISTAPFLYRDEEVNPIYEKWDFYKGYPEYISGIKPRGENPKLKRITIGNDVWLGHNVLITNGANIGNGVIAAAGAVITKDVPDYAVVMGVPAKIVRYRYTEEQIEKLNQISWWDWSDDKIRKVYADFFEDIDIFIQKHYRE